MVTLEFVKSEIAGNFQLIQDLAQARSVSLMVVAKAVCSFPPLMAWLAELGMTAMGDSQPANFRQPGLPLVQKALLKSPPSAFEGHESWDYAFVTHEKVGAGTSGLVVVIEMGDGKDGILPENAVSFVKGLRRVGNRPILGLACNFSCLLGRRPDAEAWAEFEKVARDVGPLLDGGLFSAGGTVVLEDLARGQCRGVTQVRVGEGLLLGSDSARTGPMKGFSTRGVVLRGEVIEVSDKDLGGVPLLGKDAFGRTPVPAKPGPRRRAVLDLGSLSGPQAGLQPLAPGVVVVGQTFDFLVVELSGDARDLRPGDRVGFRPDYGVLSQASLNPFVHKVLI